MKGEPGGGRSWAGAVLGCRGGGRATQARAGPGLLHARPQCRRKPQAPAPACCFTPAGEAEGPLGPQQPPPPAPSTHLVCPEVLLHKANGGAVGVAALVKRALGRRHGLAGRQLDKHQVAVSGRRAQLLGRRRAGQQRRDLLRRVHARLELDQHLRRAAGRQGSSGGRGCLCGGPPSCARRENRGGGPSLSGGLAVVAVALGLPGASLALPAAQRTSSALNAAAEAGLAAALAAWRSRAAALPASATAASATATRAARIAVTGPGAGCSCDREGRGGGGGCGKTGARGVSDRATRRALQASPRRSCVRAAPANPWGRQRGRLLFWRIRGGTWGQRWDCPGVRACVCEPSVEVEALVLSELASRCRTVCQARMGTAQRGAQKRAAGKEGDVCWLIYTHAGLSGAVWWVARQPQGQLTAGCRHLATRRGPCTGRAAHGIPLLASRRECSGLPTHGREARERVARARKV